MSTISLTDIYRYPVKGMTPERLERVTLTADETLPFDRAYAIENGKGRFDPSQPKHLPKINFLMLMRDEKLASLDARFDNQTHVLILSRDGKQVARGDLRTAIGRQLIEQFLAAYMATALRGAPKIVTAHGHSFSDVAAKCVHIVSRASLRDLERIEGKPVDALRFRPNLVIDGNEPWSELGWVGRTLTVGTTTLSVFDRTQRCDAINVDPATATRDRALPATLERRFDHTDFGLYARVVTGGEIEPGQQIVVT